MMEKIKYDSPVATITINSDGVNLLYIKDSYNAYNKNELENQFDFFYKHSKGKAVKILLDYTESINIPTDDAGLYFRETNNLENKIAIVSQNIPVQIFMGNLIKSKNVQNMRLFKSKEDAMEWLMKVKP